MAAGEKHNQITDFAKNGIGILGGEDDELDAKGFPKSKFGGGDDDDIPVMPTTLEAENYNMDFPNRGTAMVFNHKTFFEKLKLNERRGTDADRDNIVQMLQKLGFKDIRVYNDRPVKEIEQLLKQVAGENHSDNDCLAVFICSHGDNGTLYGVDRRFSTEMLWDPFTADKCPTLAGKPKLFFIQACQGDRLDKGVLVDVVDGRATYKIPIYADFLIMYSTIPGFYSWRNTTNGSWFMQVLCSVLQSSPKSQDLMSMLTVVNRKVAFEFLSCVPHDPGMDQKKQIPCISSMLTRKVYLKPKEQKMNIG